MVLYMVELDKQYPVGSIYLSVNDTDPAELFGGVWAQIKDRFLLACGDIYENGDEDGSADAIVVEHNHSPTTSNNKFLVSPGNIAVNGTRRALTSSSSSGVYYAYESTTGSASGINENSTTTTVGNSGDGANMPPYLAVYCWVRIS